LSAPESLAPALERALRARQAERLPSVAAAVVREGVVVWSAAIGTANYEDRVEATPETQYRIGSITKTFTATAVMQLRDAGLLDLDDRLEQHVAGIREGSPTIRRLLAHLSGFQREPGEMWVGGKAPTIEEVLAAMDTYELVLPAARAHHYSNLAYALLGELVARRSGTPYTRYVDERILEPLGFSRTTWGPQEPYAQGYLVDEYAGTALREVHTDLRGVAAIGQLWSTVGDLCALASFLASGRDGVLDAATVEEMWFPQVLVNPDRWDRGWGLGLELLNRDGRIFGGHGGRDAGTPRGRVRAPRVGRRRGCAHELGHPCADDGDRARACGDDARAVAARHGAVASRNRTTRRSARPPRALVVGGQRVRLHLGEGAAACTRGRRARVGPAIRLRGGRRRLPRRRRTRAR
jgi:CubicO group peptidase (beta-lactamase class C family)